MFRLDTFRPATIVGALPNTIANGQTADAVPLMADLNHIVNQVNANAAELSLTPQLANANTFTAVQSGVVATAAANFPIASQVQNAALTTLSSVAGDNTITARIQGLPLGAYTRGQIFSFVPAAGNSGATTINIDSLGAINIGRTLSSGFTVLNSSDLVAGMVALVGLTSTATRAHLLTPATSEFPVGTQIVFQQTSAPTGWTKVTDVAYNDAAMRIVTGPVVSGGLNNFTSTFGTGKSTAGYALTAAELPASALTTNAGSTFDLTTSAPNKTVGGGGSHAHTLNDFDIKYIDCVVGRKD